MRTTPEAHKNLQAVCVARCTHTRLFPVPVPPFPGTRELGNAVHNALETAPVMPVCVCVGGSGWGVALVRLCSLHCPPACSNTQLCPRPRGERRTSSFRAGLKQGTRMKQSPNACTKQDYALVHRLQAQEENPRCGVWVWVSCRRRAGHHVPLSWSLFPSSCFMKLPEQSSPPITAVGSVVPHRTSR